VKNRFPHLLFLCSRGIYGSKDEDPIIQIEVARILGETRDPGAVEPLILALKTDICYQNPSVYRMMIAAFFRFH